MSGKSGLLCATGGIEAVRTAMDGVGVGVCPTSPRRSGSRWRRVGLSVSAVAWLVFLVAGVLAGCSVAGQPSSVSGAAAAFGAQREPSPTTSVVPPPTSPPPTSPTRNTETTTEHPTSTRERDTDTRTEPPTSAAPTSEAPPRAAVRPATPPAATASAHSPFLIGTAVVVLLAAGGTVVVLVRRSPPKPSRTTVLPDSPTVVLGTPSVADAVVLMTELGEAMLDSGYDVDSVRAAVAEVAAVNGIPRAEIITLPTAMFASVQVGGQLETSAVATGGGALLLHQIEDLSGVVADACAGRTDPAGIRARILHIRALPPAYGPLTRVAANVLAAAGIAVVLGGGWPDVGVAGLLGGVVGVLFLLQLPQRYQVLLVLAAAFVVALGVFLLARSGLPLVILPSLLAPLVTLLPGAALTTGAVELSTGQMISGAGRIASGVMQLVLLAIGITGAAALAGVPVIELDAESQPLGALAPWVAVAVYGVGALVNRSARRRSIPWILLVLYVAYGAQVVGDALLGSVLSAFVGALAMTPVAQLLARLPGGPPMMVSFLPAYWLLVPGALGLEGVTSLLDGDASGFATLTTTLTTMIAISFGVLVGNGIASFLRGAPERADLTRRGGGGPGGAATP